ncbi:MAG: polyribonucleotide nucleotidyltransferase [Candidatus Vogelbacteria bacterium CG10_big_fil_rev_8_21_14_0_10_49_38]|uniref:Polyribonucleotide nucleotidyltransferase n=1 Tax=Candidatus Vogelbacteria bacterium CG10_big_fil_rev_8_21_14_0_10_49_38 TaxID=1975043 RepID=A0A2H0RH25_9BACT|nr:MAG: polyribonucleotide nucleotidyltransferase [bacterium CG10_49_38]PIR45716.1 MAG: polyribonucleotide nucleotidyltransferase [Candidatus Vogelbacteria bacterium CG10_big_fil_rev_8_21_14_0_10_49_38]
MTQKEYSLEIGGRRLSAIFSDLADQATGSVIIKYGETMLLATAVLSPQTKEDSDYFPLTVEYEERYYASGKIGGARYIKREGRPSEEAVLSGRIVDRTIRPLFDSGLRHELQVIITVLALDADNDPDMPAIVGASLALATSGIPWNGPVSSIRLGQNRPGEDFVINPTFTERTAGILDLLVCGDGNKINMIESSGQEIPESTMKSALAKASAEIALIQAWQKEIIKERAEPKLDLTRPGLPEEAKTWFEELIAPKIEDHLFSGDGKKSSDGLKEKWLEIKKEKAPEIPLGVWLNLFEDKINEVVHREAIENKRRPDGRGLEEIRPLFAQAGGFSKVVHGVGLFYRGATHVLTTLTLGGPRDSQIIEGMEANGLKFFMHHYNFPPFSVGETGRLGNSSRRSIGHGALAEKSLRGVIPERQNFPYTIRLVSEVLASNGSSSMASVCASTLALLDGGVPIKRPVAGISVGLMYRDEKNYELITDIQGVEDHYGDMDFKVAGTTEGITGIQLDIKMGGIPLAVLEQALDRARAAREKILAQIAEAIPAARADINPAAPKILKIKIAVEKIGAVIGPGGKTIQKITADTGASIEVEDDGTVYITGHSGEAEAAKNLVEEMCHEYRPGERFAGQVTRLMDFGAFVRIGAETEGLVHVSEIAPFRVERVADALKIGDEVPVVIKEIDEKHRINLSIKQADPEWAKKRGLNPPTTNFHSRN